MRHLSRNELVDFAEGLLAAERAAHADECARCREEADALRRIATDVRAVEMPEPSPLFWGHLSAQIRGAVDGEPQPNGRSDAARRWGGGMLGASRWPTGALTAALVAVTLSGLWWLAASRSPVPGGLVPPGTASSGTASSGTGPAPASTSPAAPSTSTAPPVVPRESPPTAAQIEPVSPDAGWELVTSIADREGMLDEEDLAVEIVPGVAERALLSLTVDEQRELARLLDEAMARRPDSRVAHPDS